MHYTFTIKQLDTVVSTVYLMTNPSFQDLVKEVSLFKDVMDQIITGADEEGLFSETKLFYLTKNKEIIKASPKGKYKKYHTQTPQDVVNGFLNNSGRQFNITLKQALSIQYITRGVNMFLSAEGITEQELAHIPVITFEEV